MNIKILLAFLFALSIGLFVGGAAEHESMALAYAKTAASVAAHAGDLQTIVAVEHCKDPQFFYLSIDKAGHVTPHLDPLSLEELTDVMNKAPETGGLRVCRVGEKTAIVS